MKLIIDIPEEEYELIVHDEACGLNVLTRAIANGTPLPKGHGDLIDRSKLKTHFIGTEQGIKALEQEPCNTDTCKVVKAYMNESQDKDIIWHDKRNYSEIVVKPQESEEKCELCTKPCSPGVCAECKEDKG